MIFGMCLRDDNLFHVFHRIFEFLAGNVGDLVASLCELQYERFEKHDVTSGGQGYHHEDVGGQYQRHGSQGQKNRQPHYLKMKKIKNCFTGSRVDSMQGEGQSVHHARNEQLVVLFKDASRSCCVIFPNCYDCSTTCQLGTLVQFYLVSSFILYATECSVTKI